MVKYKVKVTLKIIFDYQNNKSLKKFLSGKHMLKLSFVLKGEVKDPFEIC